jgi:16S rRNA (uracil1498-N3)-methyltransferase
MPDPRLYLDASLHEGARLLLDDAQAGKLTRVQRLGIGGGVRVFNARDGEWRAEIAEVGKRVVLAATERLRAPAPSPDLDLLFAPLKRDATDLVVEKATELGVRRLLPTITQRTNAAHVRLDRRGLIARQAAEQCERFDLPDIADPAPLPRALQGWAPGRALIWADESGEVWGGPRPPPIAEAVKGLAPGAPLAVLTGPEGGFSHEERVLLRGCAFVVPVSLGPRILRAETAALAALAIVQALAGDWR